MKLSQARDYSSEKLSSGHIRLISGQSVEITFIKLRFSGGCRFAKCRIQHTSGEILRLTEGELSPIDCIAEDEKGLAFGNKCYICSFRKELDHAINDHLNKVTLQDIVDMKFEHYSNDYVI